MERIAYTVTQDISAKLDSTSKGEILTLIANEPDPVLESLQNRENVFHAVKNLYIKNLTCTVEVPSLPETPAPEIENTDSDTAAFVKTMATEWSEHRKELELLKWDIGNNQWVRKARISLINREGVPYQQYNVYDFLTGNLIYELGQGAKLGFRITQIPGFLSGNDFVMFDGNYVEEYIILSEANNNIPVSEPEIPSIMGGQIISRDPAWNITSYEIRSAKSLAGEVKFGYYFTRNKMNLLLYGGGGTNGNLKKIQIINNADDSVLFEKSLAELIGSDSNVWVNYVIDTSNFYGKMVYFKFIDEDATGQQYSFFAVELSQIFAEE